MNLLWIQIKCLHLFLNKALAYKTYGPSISSKLPLADTDSRQTDVVHVDAERLKQVTAETSTNSVMSCDAPLIACQVKTNRKSVVLVN